MIKKLSSLFLSMLVLLSCLSASVSAFAKDNQTYSKEVEISKSDKNHIPDEEIRVDGKTYKFVDYDIVDEKLSTFTVKKEKLKSKDYTAEQTAVNPDDKSSKGKLISTAFEEETENNRKTTVTKELKYSAVQTDYSFPESYQTEYADKETDRKITASLKLISVNKSNPYWIDTSAMEGIVTGYDALVYTLANSNMQIPKNTEKPNYKGYENAILKSLNLSSNNYRITGAAWSGEAYYNSDSILCRNCTYSVQLKVCDAMAVYESKIDLPDKVTYTAVSTYEDEAAGKLVLSLNYEQVKDNTKTIVIGAVLGILVLSVLIAAVLIYLSRKKKSEEILNAK